MKQLFTIMMLMLSITASAQLQEDGAIYSPDGFTVKTSSIEGRYYTYETTGLYTADGKTLVAIMYMDDPAYMSVLPSTERIAPNALRSLASTETNYRICIPTAVKYVYPESFITSKGATGQMAIVLVTDEVKEVATSIKELNDSEETEEVKETARYNLQGMKIDGPSKGINIVKMSDNSSRKIFLNE